MAEEREGFEAKELMGGRCSAPVEAVASRCCNETQTFLIEHSRNLEIVFTCTNQGWYSEVEIIMSHNFF